MRKTLLIIFSLITYSGFSQLDENPTTANSLIGKWCGIENGYAGCTLFDESGFITFTSKESSFGGADYEYNGKHYIYKYEVDYAHSPILLDIVIFIKGIEKEEKRFKSIVRFLDANTIEMKTGKKGYPKEFTSKKEEPGIILKKSISNSP